MNLEELIEKCCQQNIEAQSEIYQLYAGKLFGLCLKYCRNYEDAQDMLQDSFITIFKKINQYKHKGSFEGWLKRITIHTALAKYRKATEVQLIKEDETEDIEENIIKQDNMSVDFLLKLIQQLPDRYRLVFNLYVLDNFSHKEIANLLRITEGTSKSNLSRAKQLLREKINAYQQKTVDE